MNTSETINELAAALSKAQAEMQGAKKDSTNPHFKSAYADLASVWEACRAALTKHGLSVLQSPRATSNNGAGWSVEVETRLLHSSGQWMADTLTVPVGKADAQGVGSAVTYARRYALAAFVGVAPDDDDGNAATSNAAAHRQEEAAKEAARPPKGFDQWFLDMKATADNGQAALKQAWTDSRADFRTYVTQHRRDEWEALKAKAAQNGLVTA